MHESLDEKLAVGCLALGLLAPACGRPPVEETPPPGPRVRVVETGPLHIDKIYPSMTGPDDRIEVDISDMDWVTTYRTEVVDALTGEPMGDEFFCHSQLQIPNATRLMVTATGSAEIRFPEGFGMPLTQIVAGLPADERWLTFLGMALNNHRPDIDRYAKIRATVEYWTNADVGTPPRLKKLYKVGLPMTVEDLEGYTPPPEMAIDEDVTTHCVLVEGIKGHWIVPPGPQITRKEYDRIVPVDARVHYAIVHLHNYGVYLRLTDKTTGEKLWQTNVVYEPDRVQILEIPHYSSAEGFPVYKDHVYEIEASYDNTTDHDVDAMALIDLYYHPLGDENITYASGPTDG